MMRRRNNRDYSIVAFGTSEEKLQLFHEIANIGDGGTVIREVESLRRRKEIIIASSLTVKWLFSSFFSFVPLVIQYQ